MKKNKKIKVVSLFSGCGGSDLGILGGFDFLGKKYQKLPTEIVFALDNDKKAVQTYNLNFKHPAVHNNIETVSMKDIPDEVDIVVGGFPCQSFSTVNPNKDPFDERGQLYKYMAIILKQKKPKVFIAENVKGMLTLQNGAIYKKIEAEFSKAGYVVQHKVINAADYGVPQKRQRVFMLGIRKDIKKIFEYPIETNSQSPSKKQTKWVGISKIIDNLELDDSKYYFSKKAVMGMRSAKNNMKRGLSQNLNEPCLTVTSHLAKVSINSRDPVLLVDKEKDLFRRFTPREAARIQSFPDSFIFSGSEADAYRQIGNAIAPVVMWHITKKIINFLKENNI
jgi:DNA (cytosine-5)-methyltransferase 1